MRHLLPQFPASTLTADQLRSVQHGRSLAAEADSQWIQLLSPDGELAALAQREAPGLFHPEVVLIDTVPAPSSSHETGAEQQDISAAGSSRQAR
jgi:hypothetical protein